jgi:ABC-2 type transport system permease protein
VLWAYARQGFIQGAAYRAEVWLKYPSMLMYVFLETALWIALYKGKSISPDGIGLAAMLNYVLLANLTHRILSAGWGASESLQAKLRDGTIIADLIRPVPLPIALAAQAVGAAAWVFVGYVLPGLVFLPLILSYIPLGFPAGLGSAGLFALSLLLGFWTAYFLYLLVHLTGFWTLEVFGILGVFHLLSELFSGEILPIWFFPGFLKTLALILPFQAMLSTPISIYIGRLAGREALLFVALQGVWVVALAALCWLVWKRAILKITIQGG